MLHGKKMILAGAGLIALAGVLASFKGKQDDDKKKRYQVIHHADGKIVEYDTVVPMNSSYTVDNFLADKGIESDNVEIIEIASGQGGNVFISNDEGGKHEQIIVKEMGDNVFIESHSDKEVKMICEVGEDGEMVTRKFVNGEEVEVTEEDLKQIQINEGNGGEKVIKMEVRSEHGGEDLQWTEKSENVKIICDVDDDGNMKVQKFVNGEEVEVSEEEIKQLKGNHGDHKQHMVIKIDGDNIEDFELETLEELNIELDELDGLGEELEIKIEQILEEVEEMEFEEGESKVIMKRIEVDSRVDGDHEEVIIIEGDQIHESNALNHEMRFISNDEEDFTVVIVTEDYDPSQEVEHNVRVENKQPMKGADLSVYPNPTEGVVTIRLNQPQKLKTRIEVVDAQGKSVFKENLGKFSGEYSKELNLKEFGSGIYIINIEQGGDVRSEKVVVK